MRLLKELGQDLRYALRLICKSPGFAATAVLTLALGIGFNCAAFSVLNTVLLRTPPYPEADRIVDLRQANATRGLSQQLVSVPDYLDLRHNNHVFESMAAWNFQYFNLSGADEPERLEGLTVTSEFFSTLKINPVLGRSFVPEDELPGRGRVAILSDGLWKRRFGADPTIVGRTVAIEGEPYVVVGVLPQDFRLFRVLNRDLDLYVPQTLDPSRVTRADHLLFVYARLRPGVSIGQAREEMERAAANLAMQYPDTNTGWTVEMQELHRQWTGGIRPTLVMLQTAVAVVLLIACINLASLLLARSMARQREMAIRTALGAGRLRLFRQLVAEGIALGALGGVAGTAASLALIASANRIPYSVVNRVVPFTLDFRVLVFGFVLAGLAGLLVGIAAAVQCSVGDLKPDVARGQRTGKALLFSQVALTAVLLSAAGLLLRSSLLVSGMPRGLDTSNVLSAQIWLPPARYRDSGQVARFWRDAVERAAALPGVQSASVVNFPPLSVLSTDVGVVPEGSAATRRGEEPVVQYWVAGPRYFETTRIPVLAGRTFGPQDTAESPGVVMVSAEMARRFWPGESALGKRIRPVFPQSSHYWLPKSQTGWLTVVGIAGDIRLDGIAQTHLPQMYLSYLQAPTSILHLMVRTHGDPMQMAGAIRHEIAMLDHDQPVFDVKSLEDVMAESTTRADVLTRLLGVFSAVAMMLAVIGIYGVTACWTSRRTREVGVRMALGARPAEVVRLMAAQGLPAVLLGAGVGTAGVVWVGRVLRTFLVGVGATDLPTLAGVPTILLLAATAAALVPALRAARIDPMTVLRHE